MFFQELYYNSLFDYSFWNKLLASFGYFELKILIDECSGAHFVFKTLRNFKEI